MTVDIAALFSAHEADRYALHSRHLNEQMVRMLRAIGYDVRFTSGRGQYLYDQTGQRYLDLLSGFGVFALGRNHPTVRDALKSVLDSDLPNLVQLDVAPLAGILAQRLLARVPGMQKVFFANSGAEAVEGALKFARMATGRAAVAYCSHAFHGLTYGALSLNGDAIYRDGFGPLLPECREVAFNDLAALDALLRKRDVAAFIVEPVQGKGVHLPAADYLAEALKLCRRYGTLFIADEIQCGLGRTGRFLALEHWGIEPDMVLLAKALSGGHVPVGAVLGRAAIFDKVFDRIDRAVVHGSTFAKNDMAMAAGIATLEVLENERLIEHAAQMGTRLLARFQPMVGRYEMLKEVRGLGLMLGLEFGAPRSLTLKPSWSLLETASKGLFCQSIAIPLFKEHHMLCQVSGHESRTIKLLPSYMINGDDCDSIGTAFEQVIADSHRVGTAVSLTKTLVGHALKARA
ncbi:MAG: aspartate aminotransferase family protein [Janthinobacterium lividum]